MDVPLPSSPPAVSTSTFYHRAGNYAIVALAGSMFVNIAALSAGPAPARFRQIVALVVGAVMLSAIPAGVIALLGVRKHGKKGLLWKGLVGVLVPLLLVALAVPAFLKVRDASHRLQAVAAAREISATAPQMIDESTRLDGALVEDGRLILRFTVVSLSAAEVDRRAWNEELVPMLRENIKNSGLWPLVQRGTIVVYRYAGNDGAPIDEIVFDPKEIRSK